MSYRSINYLCSIVVVYLLEVSLGLESSTFPQSAPVDYRPNSLALLSGTLRSYQKAVCGDEWVSIKCPEGTEISVQFAQYGRTAGTDVLCPSPTAPLNNNASSRPNSCYSQRALQSVVNGCQKKTECGFKGSPEFFGGDPCPSAPKFVEIAYKCRPRSFRSMIGCEGDTLQLSCNPGWRIAIYLANFGRTEYESLTCPSEDARLAEQTCLASYSTEKVMGRCNGKRRCGIRADSAEFGSPCKRGARMYLKVIHTCVPRKVLKKKYRGELESDEVDEGEEGEDDGGTSSSTGASSSNDPPPYPPTGGAAAGVIVEDGEEDLIRSSSVVNQDAPPAPHNSSASPSDVQLINLISQTINAYGFIERNSHTFWLLVAISMSCVFLLLLCLLFLRVLWIRLRRRRKVVTGEPSAPRPPSSTIIRRDSTLGFDLDELSLVMEPTDYMTIGRSRAHASGGGGGGGVGGGAPPSSTSTFGGKVVRYSNCKEGMRRESSSSPKSFHQLHHSDIHFFG